MLILEKLNLSFFRLMNYNLQSTIEFPILKVIYLMVKILLELLNVNFCRV